MVLKFLDFSEKPSFFEDVIFHPEIFPVTFKKVILGFCTVDVTIESNNYTLGVLQR